MTIQTAIFSVMNFTLERVLLIIIIVWICSFECGVHKINLCSWGWRGQRGWHGDEEGKKKYELRKRKRVETGLCKETMRSHDMKTRMEDRNEHKEAVRRLERNGKRGRWWGVTVKSEREIIDSSLTTSPPRVARRTLRAAGRLPNSSLSPPGQVMWSTATVCRWIDSPPGNKMKTTHAPGGRRADKFVRL